ncbi:uncharacterized protein BO95DRAFT_444573 [Aspergillus brunneoviolaceus CBS 621.78]|uniref:Uncharacterized protein n=1 Tax=Aspergillus brunneoviolaceus CBS 621.78 TaxID=1450534 RepID=A0ACD1G439_9EURO|nr:hypothetical protein BO95DRAFT_444573 [Aspergillus brunneoviolaceus CBS 621.78]RAH44005.1 hypothetical protein BO95DRAFT_444573 [Aspergillus brunneoviolaceus CBS 621.78]
MSWVGKPSLLPMPVCKSCCWIASCQAKTSHPSYPSSRFDCQWHSNRARFLSGSGPKYAVRLKAFPNPVASIHTLPVCCMSKIENDPIGLGGVLLYHDHGCGRNVFPANMSTRAHDGEHTPLAMAGRGKSLRPR